jgi:ATP-dependent DNA helicase RecG
VRTEGKQAVFLAPLEILAQQHFLSLSKLLLPLGIRIELLSGSLTPATKKQVKQRLRDGNIDIIV